MENIYLKFYEEDKDLIHKDEFGEIDLAQYPFLTFEDPFYKLRKNIYIGKLDRKSTFGFLRQKESDIYIDGPELMDAMDNDIVLVEVPNFEARIVAILKRALEHIVVTVKMTKKGKLRLYTDVDLGRRIEVEHLEHVVSGHVLLLNVEHISKNTIFCSLDKIIGHVNDPDIETLKIVSNFMWPSVFSDELIDSISTIKIDMDYEKKTRETVDELIVTIDGKDAKDLDDAISLKMVDGNYHLGVHIADVSYYVEEDTLLDKEAYKRATSAYLADRVIPMLPHKLSNDWCSLNPNELKLTLSCFMVLNSEAKVIDYEIKKTIIKSNMRLTYDAVNQLFKQNETIGDKQIDDMLFRMLELSQKLAKLRRQRGEIEFKSSELGFKVNEQGKVLDVYERKTDQAEELIESLMLIANETVASHMYHASIPSIYRTHAKPDADKLRKAVDLISLLGVTKDVKHVDNPKVLQKIVDKTIGSPYEYIVHMTLLRAMQKAKYNHHQDIHYGLGAQFYAHFTSPIRRYPDLILHRLIHKFVLNETNDFKKDYEYYESNMHEIAEHTSLQERTAVQMEREVAKLKSCEYMQDKLFMKFKGTITQMMKSGMFVKLDNGIEGFLALRSLRDYYSFDESQMLYVTAYGKKLRLGDRIDVVVTDVNIVERHIDFGLYEENKKWKKRS